MGINLGLWTGVGHQVSLLALGHPCGGLLGAESDSSMV